MSARDGLETCGVAPQRTVLAWGSLATVSVMTTDSMVDHG